MTVTGIWCKLDLSSSKLSFGFLNTGTNVVLYKCKGSLATLRYEYNWQSQFHSN